MYVCMYVCMYVFDYEGLAMRLAACMYVCMCSLLQSWPCDLLRVCMYVCMYLIMKDRLRVIHNNGRVHVCMCACMYVCMYYVMHNNTLFSLLRNIVQYTQPATAEKIAYAHKHAYTRIDK
jgi:hypothetical protein